MYLGFRGVSLTGLPFSSALDFAPASSSSSKMEEDARSPRTRVGCCGFFLRNSSDNGFRGLVFNASLVSVQKSVRRWMLGLRKESNDFEVDRAVAIHQLVSIFAIQEPLIHTRPH